MKMRMWLRVIGIMGLVFLAPNLTNATVVRKVELTQLVEHSAVILRGIVRAVDDDLSTSCKGPFRTRVDVEVIQ